MAAPYADDPDPTSQMAWPTAHRANPQSTSGGDGQLSQADRYKASTSSTKPKSPQRNASKNDDSTQSENIEIGRKRLTTWQLFKLSISMAGAQIAWTVELGYGVLFIVC